MNDKITGVCVDIPTVIHNAKMDQLLTKLNWDDQCDCYERVIEEGINFIMTKHDFRTLTADQFRSALRWAAKLGNSGEL